MLLLQSYERFSDVAIFNPENGRFDVRNKSMLGPEYSGKTNGFYSFLDAIFVALYALDKEILLCVDGNFLKLSESTKIDFLSNGTSKRLSAIQMEKNPISIEYKNIKDKNIKGDMTPFIEDESFDFGLFIANIAANLDRQAVFLEVNAG